MIQSSNLGYPRIGQNREWKKTLEAYWAQKVDESTLEEQLKEIRIQHLREQQDAGIDLIPVNDFTKYDQMLDTATMFGIIPERYEYDGGEVSNDLYFAMARGTQSATASEMTKWFNTNYHYIVPELDSLSKHEPKLTINRPLEAYLEAKRELNIEGKPVLIGPYTFVSLSKGFDRAKLEQVVEQLLPLYVQVLQELADAGAKWVQVDEPSFVTTDANADWTLIKNVYEQLTNAVPQLNILLQTYFGTVDRYEQLIALPVAGVGLDFSTDESEALAQIKKFGFPQDKVLGAGVIDGRSIWRASLKEKVSLVTRIRETIQPNQLWIQPSASLMFVPVSTQPEVDLEPELKEGLAFANEKLQEIHLLTSWFTKEKTESLQAQIDESEQAVANLQALRERTSVTLPAITPELYTRAQSFEERRQVQEERFQLPLFPTTTIGSFPQTKEVRSARANYRKGNWTQEQYEAFIQAEIKTWIELQEEIELDVLVHGEFERTDMVEFFGEKLGGFAFTLNGWVQSYGSRCVRPPIIYKDVQFVEPMTVKESVYAKSLTNKPIKGMLTGPITILNWSFVRSDLSRETVANQIAFALREEVAALEAADIRMIQVDEPALREGLPLKKEDWEEYLDWSVKAFKIATSSVQAGTQIHTHMCYCEFEDIIDSIRALDADVISIETSRSHGELIEAFEKYTYPLGIGLGVYDIHSPRVPETTEMTQMADRALQVLDPKLFWINPDCGLKTRGREETVAALKNMVAATKEIRDKYAVTQ